MLRAPALIVLPITLEDDMCWCYSQHQRESDLKQNQRSWTPGTSTILAEYPTLA
jgi:hypothetical protein